MKNRILLTVAMALIGLFTFSITAEAQRGRGVRGQLTINVNQCGNGLYFNNINNTMCMHMRNIWRGGRNVRGIVRCNHRGCGMFGSSFRNGRFYNIPRGHGNFNRGGRAINGQFNQGGGRGNNGRYNQGGGRGNNGQYNQGGGRGNNGQGNQGGGRGNGRNNNNGGGRGQGNGSGR